jgi:hypothetical protein
MDSSIWFIIIPILVGIGIILQLRSGRRTNYDSSRDDFMRRHQNENLRRMNNDFQRRSDDFMRRQR